MRIGVIDYGVGNLGSVLRALEELKVEASLLDSPKALGTVDKAILPGVGNFSDCIALLDAGGWVDGIRSSVNHDGRPLLGVCVGMQLLGTASTEGASGARVAGLGLVPGKVEHLRDLGCGLRVPHVGWNEVQVRPIHGGLFDGIPDGTDFYFVHSYAFVADDAAHVAATTDYGVRVTAAVRRGIVWGTQFHPEKSSRAGFRVLRNFAEWSAPC
jgi:imidazole glycerol-phosphate synthase subunit HisH